MELQLIKEKNVPLLNRKRIALMASFSGKSTPSKNNLRKEIAKLAKTKEELVSIRHVYQKFGTGEAKVIAHIYDNVRDLKYLEGEKAALKEEKPKEAAPKESPKEEQPKEEPKAEEAPKEEAPVEAPKEEPKEGEQ